MAEKLSTELIETICNSIADGSSLREAARNVNIPESTIRKFLKDTSTSFYAQYVRAREDRANTWAEEFVEIADSIEQTGDSFKDRNAVDRAKVRLDARKWVVSRILAKVYGDKLNVEHEIGDNLAEIIAKGRKRVERIKSSGPRDIEAIN